MIPYLGGGFKHFLFSPLPGEMIQFDEHIFQMGWFNHQPVIQYDITLVQNLHPSDVNRDQGAHLSKSLRPRSFLMMK